MHLEELENRRLLSIALPSIPANTFNVTAYGVVADGTTNNAVNIQKAITAATKAGGGTVEIPAAAEPYESGPITLASNINFQVDAGAELQALSYSSYPNAGSSSVSNFITAKNISNFEITGGGTIDGNGAAWWTAYNANNSLTRPRLINITGSNTILIQGLTLQNSPMFHIAFGATNTVTINDITINSPATSPNTDGIDPAGQHYLIENCSISTGDDNIAVKPQDVFCGDITVTDCFFGVGHGLSIGGETNDGLNGMTVTNCTFDGTTAGIRLKAERTEGGLVQNVSYSNLTMTDVEYPININSYYNIGSVPTNPQDPAQTVTATTPIWQNITITNVTSSWDTTGGEYTNSYCGIIWGLPEEPVNTVTLSNVQISAKYGMDLDHVRNVSFDVLSNFTAASGGSLISTKTAPTPYDAQLSEFANLSSNNQAIRIVSAGSLVDYFSNGNLLASINPAVITSLLITDSGSSDTATLDYSAGNLGIPITINATGSADALSILGASPSDSFTMNSSQITHGSSTVAFSGIPTLAFSNGLFALTTDLAGAALQINNAANVSLSTDQHLSALSFAGTGQLDIADQALYLAQTGSAADSGVFGLLQSSYQNGWAGSGITSSATLNEPANTTGIGYFDNGSQIAIARSWYGDANLDGVINADDLSIMLLGHAQGTTRWQDGNFNYDAQVNADDWIKFAYALAYSQGQSLPAFADNAFIQASDPSEELPASRAVENVPIFATTHLVTDSDLLASPSLVL
jgi:polygalacturonase